MRAALAEKLALAAEHERLAGERRSADPTTWGVAPGLGKLDTSADIRVTRDGAGEAVAFGRRDVFDALLAAGGLSLGQHVAARRLIRDWATMLGVAGAPAANQNAGGEGDGELVNMRMIRAHDQVRLAMGAVGPATARVLAALVEPLVSVGVGASWRDQVEQAAGEAERHAQGAVVRLAAENLRLVYQAIDQGRLRLPRRDEAA